MVFVTMHIANLALNLISIDAADAGLEWLTQPWRSLPGTVLLYGAAAVHVVLVLRTLYLKRTLKMPAKEAAQIVLGLLIPLLIAEHVIGTRVYGTMTGVDIDYEFVTRALWVDSPATGVKQVFALLVIWAHGCLGLHFWLRYRDWYPKAAPWLLIGAVLVPVLGLLGFAEAGKTVLAMARPGPPAGVAPERIAAALATKDVFLRLAYAVAIASVAATLLLRVLRHASARRNLVEVRYEGGQVVRVPKGSTVLEASRIGGIPHYSVCGGKGRCSTCRVRVTAGLAELPEPGPLERMTLTRIHAGPDVRLACQLRPTEKVTVLPLLAAPRERAFPAGARPAAPGREQEIAVLFCDIRSFTALADHRLPYDIVFLLNRYFAIVGKAVEQSGGRLDKFIGDGAMALFGLDTSTAQAARQAPRGFRRDPRRARPAERGACRRTAGAAEGRDRHPCRPGDRRRHGVWRRDERDGDRRHGECRKPARSRRQGIQCRDCRLRQGGDALRPRSLRLRIEEIEIRGSTRPLHVRVVPQGTTLEAGFAETPPAQSAA